MPQQHTTVPKRDGRPLISIPPAAEYLCIGVRTLKTLIAAGEIPVVRVSRRRIAIDPQDLDAFIESRRS